MSETFNPDYKNILSRPASLQLTPLEHMTCCHCGHVSSTEKEFGEHNWTHTDAAERYGTMEAYKNRFRS